MVTNYINIKKIIFIFCFVFAPAFMAFAEELTLDQAKLEIQRLQQENLSLKEQLDDFEKQIKELKEEVEAHEIKNVNERE